MNDLKEMIQNVKLTSPGLIYGCGGKNCGNRTDFMVSSLFSEGQYDSFIRCNKCGYICHDSFGHISSTSVNSEGFLTRGSVVEMFRVWQKLKYYQEMHEANKVEIS